MIKKIRMMKEYILRWLKQRKEKQEILKYCKTYFKITPKPFTGNKANIVLEGVVAGNVDNITKLLQMVEEVKDDEAYGKLKLVLDQYFLSREDIFYRNYFLDSTSGYQVLLNPEQHWKKIISGYQAIKFRIIELRGTAIQYPDHYFYITQLERVCSVVETFINPIKNIEN